MNKNIIPCSNCGSSDTYLTSALPINFSQDSLTEIIEKAVKNIRTTVEITSGENYLICRNCGKLSIVMIN